MSRLYSSRRLFFFSSRRRHTRLVSDWSSDVCSSDLAEPARGDGEVPQRPCARAAEGVGDLALRSEERREGKSVDLGGRRIIRKKTGGNNTCRWRGGLV